MGIVQRSVISGIDHGIDLEWNMASYQNIYISGMCLLES